MKFTKEYRAHLTLPNNQTTCTVNGNDLQAVQTTISSLVRANSAINTSGKPCRFDAETVAPTVLIFHDSYQNGQEPLGWITEADVPVALSTRTLIEQRQQGAARVAA